MQLTSICQWCHDTQHNDTQHDSKCDTPSIDDNQHDNTQHPVSLCCALLCYDECHFYCNAECCYADYNIALPTAQTKTSE